MEDWKAQMQNVRIDPGNFTYDYARRFPVELLRDHRGTDKKRFVANADTTYGAPLFDFAVVGFPKCGTTTMVANLGQIAPLTAIDICVPPTQAVWYSYHLWSKGKNLRQDDYRQDLDQMYWRGVKCPTYMENESFLNQFGQQLRRTGLVVGIRHPILWFQSFYNMQSTRRSGTTIDNPYNRMELCHKRGSTKCRISCNHGKLFCLHRGRFHVALARMGKTPLSAIERTLLAPKDHDGGNGIQNYRVPNPVFLYEQHQLAPNHTMWYDLAHFLHYGNKNHTTTSSGSISLVVVLDQ